MDTTIRSDAEIIATLYAQIEELQRQVSRISNDRDDLVNKLRAISTLTL